MSTDVKPFKPESIQEKITERIRGSFVDLVPEAAWQQLVQAEIDRFLRQPTQDWNNREPMAPLQALIRDELTARFRTQIKDTLSLPEFNGVYDAGKWGPSDIVRTMLEELTPKLISAMFGHVVMDVLNKVRNQV